jgi:uroporphyrinogen-III synthase
MHRPTVVITRPQPEAEAWRQALQSQGWPALALPLLRLNAPHSSDRQAAVVDLWGNLSACDALMFVSSAAVRFFFEARPPGWRPPTRWPRCWVPGPGTAQVLQAALAQIGADVTLVDSPDPGAVQFDSEALWQTVAPQLRPGFRLWLVRGDSDALAPMEAIGGLPGVGRDWLSQTCLAQGAEVQAVVAYERRLRTWTSDTDARDLQSALDVPVWQLSNRESLQALDTVPAERWCAKTAVATHPRIAEAAKILGFGRVHLCAPGMPALVRALESLHP